METSTGKESSLIYKDVCSYSSEHLYSDPQKHALEAIKKVSNLHGYQKLTAFKSSKANANAIIGIDINPTSLQEPMRAVCQFGIDGRIMRLEISTSESISKSIDILLGEIKINLLNHIKSLEKCQQKDPDLKER